MPSEIKHVDLCSGIGGFALGFEQAELSSPVLFCEKDLFCQKVLQKNWPTVPLALDVKELADDAERLVPKCDIITAGYPCQPFSSAGLKRGDKDDRHLWPYIREILKEKRPACCVFENVRGHVKLGLDNVLSDLSDIEYSPQAFVVPASFFGAPHRRDRVWIVAYSDSPLTQGGGLPSGIQQKQPDTHQSGYRGGWKEGGDWKAEPKMGRVAYGLPSWVDTNNRNKALGNAIVPQIAYRIGQCIKKSFEFK